MNELIVLQATADGNYSTAGMLETGRTLFNLLIEWSWAIALIVVVLAVLFIYFNRKKKKFSAPAVETHFKTETKKELHKKLSSSKTIEEKTDKSYSFGGRILSQEEMGQVEELAKVMRSRTQTFSSIEMTHAIINQGFEPRIAEEVVKKLYRK